MVLGTKAGRKYDLKPQGGGDINETGFVGIYGSMCRSSGIRGHVCPPDQSGDYYQNDSMYQNRR